MENIKKLIEKYSLIKQGDMVGIGVSGGRDSMALLCFLNEIKHELGFDILAITIDHMIRENSKKEVAFVEKFCKEHNIKVCKFQIDCINLSKEKGVSIESGAREARYGVFEKLLNEKIVDKIALAHHKFDQAETVLMHLFRGSGIKGLTGMTINRDNKYIRPMLNTDKNQIDKYIEQNNIPYMQDESNFDNEYNRNYIRNEILPLITNRWSSAVNAIINFANLASEDDEYIMSQVPLAGLMVQENTVKIPLSYFLYPRPITSRLLYYAMHAIGINKDIENKHIDIILNFIKARQNGKRLQLPLSLCVYIEYDYLTLVGKQKQPTKLNIKHKLGSFMVENFGELVIKKIGQSDINNNILYYDPDKLPSDVVWRFRQDGDMFSKFGGGTKKLKDYLIDIKYPQRQRNILPVLASGNEVFIIGTIAISSKIKIDENTTKIYQISLKKPKNK
jgi:tRNA(Ile)-lysidine synthase